MNRLFTVPARIIATIVALTIGLAAFAGPANAAPARSRTLGVTLTVNSNGAWTRIGRFHTWGEDFVTVIARSPSGLTSGGTDVRISVAPPSCCVTWVGPTQTLTSYDDTANWQLSPDFYFYLDVRKRWAGGPDNNFSALVILADV